jgi:hypothetical protein
MWGKTAQNLSALMSDIRELARILALTKSRAPSWRFKKLHDQS